MSNFYYYFYNYLESMKQNICPNYRLYNLVAKVLIIEHLKFKKIM